MRKEGRERRQENGMMLMETVDRVTVCVCVCTYASVPVRARVFTSFVYSTCSSTNTFDTTMIIYGMLRLLAAPMTNPPQLRGRCGRSEDRVVLV